MQDFSESVYSFGTERLTGKSNKSFTVPPDRMSKESISAAIRPITEKFTGPFKADVLDINDITTLPKELQEYIQDKMSKGAELKGVYDDATKTSYLLASSIKDTDEAQRILFHEMAHHGIDGLLGKRYESTMNHILLSADKVKMADIAERYGLDMKVKSDRLLAAEEYLTEMAETSVKPGVAARIYAFIREALRSLGFNIEFKDADIRDFLARAKEYAQSGGPVFTDVVNGKIRDFRGALEYKEPGMTWHSDTHEMSLDSQYGMAFLGGDMLHKDRLGNVSPQGILLPDYKSEWTLSKHGMKAVANAAHRGYSTIAIVAYPHVQTAMQLNPIYHSNIERTLIQAYGTRVGKGIIKQARMIAKDHPGKPYGNILVSLQPGKEMLKKGQKRVTLMDVAQNVAVPGWQDMAGKIVGVGKFKEAFVSDGKQMDMFAGDYKNDTQYPGVIKFENYYKLPKPIDFKDIVNNAPGMADNHKKSVWLMMRSVAFWMNKSHSPVIEALIKAAHGDTSVLEKINGMEEGPTITQPSRFKGALKSVNPEVDEAWAGARGLKDKTAWEKVKDHLTDIRSNIEHFKHYESSWKGAEETLRTYENVSNYAANKAAMFMNGTVKILKSKENQDLFERVVILRDLVSEASAGKLAKTFAETGELPFKYHNVEEMKADLANFEKMAAANPQVTKAIDARNEFFNELRADMVKHGVLPENILGNEDYFHHQVHIYANMENYGSGLVSKDVRKSKQPWQRSRTGYAGDYNTNYFEAESKVMMSMVNQVETAKTHLKLASDFQPVFDHVLNETRREAQALGVNETKYIKENLKKNIEKYAPGSVAWQPERGNFMYETLSLTERNMKKVMDHLGDVRSFETEMNMSKVSTYWIGLLTSITKIYSLRD